MRIKISVLIFLLLPFAVAAQEVTNGYYAGYIVNVQGDTLRGTIKKESNFISPETVKFKTNGKETEYGPMAIKGFYIEELNLLFESNIISKNENNNTEKPIRGGLSDINRKGTHFLLTIIKAADYGFYSYIEKRGKERLYFKKDDTLEELLLINQYVAENKIQEKKRYRIQLLGLLIDCESAKTKINSSNYTSNSMEAILKAYAGCQGDDITYNRYANKGTDFKFRFGLNAAYGSVLSASPKVESPATPEDTRVRAAEFDTGSWFEFGLTAMLVSKRDSRLDFRAELKIKNQTVETEWNRALPVENVLSRVNHIYETTFISLGLLVDFKLARWDNGGMFLELGGVVGTGLSGSFESIEGVFRGGGTYSNISEVRDIIIRKSDILLAAGLGAQFNRLAASLRFSSSVSDDIEETTRFSLTTVSGLSLNLFYLFN